MEFDNALFLETTIQIGRIWGNPEVQKKIEKVLSKFQCLLSSTYVKMEFKRRVIREFVYLYNMLSSVDSFSDMFFRIEKLPPVQLRKIKGILASFGNFFLYLQGEHTKEPMGNGLLEIAYHYFKHMGEIAWEKFDDKINAIINETDCLNAKEGPKFDGDKIYLKLSCKQTVKKCKIVEFFENNRDHITKIYKKFSQEEGLDSEQRKMKKIIEKALRYPQNMANYKNCWSCGDLIIALECPGKSILFTTNIRHYEPLCKEMGKKTKTLEN